MYNLDDIFKAGFVRRWHTDPYLAHTGDRLDAHQGRVARIIAALHPEPSARLLIAALTHDDGEALVGDIPASAKGPATMYIDGMEAIARWRLWGDMPNLSDDDRLWLRFADRLDAYMWAIHHAPHLASRDDWRDARDELRDMASRLGVSNALEEMTCLIR